jgi:hypothetical protein
LSKTTNKGGLNVIPLKGLNIQTDSKTGTINEKASPRNKMNLANNINSVTISPKATTLIKLPQTTKNAENKIHFDTTKNTHKSPSPSKGTNTITSKFTKKSPDVGNTKK